MSKVKFIYPTDTYAVVKLDERMDYDPFVYEMLEVVEKQMAGMLKPAVDAAAREFFSTLFDETPKNKTDPYGPKFLAIFKEALKAALQHKTCKISSNELVQQVKMIEEMRHERERIRQSASMLVLGLDKIQMNGASSDITRLVEFLRKVAYD